MTLSLALRITALIGVSLLLMGLVIMTVPAFPAFVFDQSENESNLVFTQTMGVRQLFLGVTFLVLLRKRQYRALSLYYLWINILPVTDGLIALFHHQGNSWKALLHVGYLPFTFWLSWFFSRHTKQQADGST